LKIQLVSHSEHTLSFIKKCQSIHVAEKIFLSRVILAKRINSLGGQKVKTLSFKPGVIYVYKVPLDLIWLRASLSVLAKKSCVNVSQIYFNSIKKLRFIKSLYMNEYALHN
jgi:hypothetical protein